MKALVAGLIAGTCGLLQLIAILFIETQDDSETSGLLSSDRAFPLFALLVLTEILSVMALSMYRIAPWLLRFMGDKWEANRVTNAKKSYGVILQRAAVIASITRRVVVMADAGAFSTAPVLSLGVALAAFLVPLPKI